MQHVAAALGSAALAGAGPVALRDAPGPPQDPVPQAQQTLQCINELSSTLSSRHVTEVPHFTKSPVCAEHTPLLAGTPITERYALTKDVLEAEIKFATHNCSQGTAAGKEESRSGVDEGAWRTEAMGDGTGFRVFYLLRKECFICICSKTNSPGGITLAIFLP